MTGTTLTDQSIARVIAPSASSVTLSSSELCALVRAYADDPSSWAPYLRYPGEGEDRWWTRLQSAAGVDVWLLSWLPGHTTEFHDHGASVAAFQVVQGALLEVRPSTSSESGVHTRHAGDLALVPAGDIHDVISDQVAVSIHAYSPPLDQMTYYRVGEDGVLEATETLVTDDPEEGPRR